MDSTRTSWTANAEAAILTLRDIEGVSIQAEGDEVREVHVLTASSRPAKQIVRDVQTLLLTRFGQPIDHRVVSVAYTDAKPVVGASAKAVTERPATAKTTAEPSPPPVTLNKVPVPTQAASRAAALAADADRVRFVSANVYVSGPRVQAQVELRWRGVPRMGSASGWSTRDAAHRLIATATIAAVQEYLEEGIALSLEGLRFVRLGRRSAAVVALELLAHREQKTLIGCCAAGQDRQQAVVLATLSALNRVLGGLPSPEPSVSK